MTKETSDSVLSPDPSEPTTETAEPSSDHSSPPHAPASVWGSAAKIGVVVLAVLILALGGLGVGIYRYGWNSPIVQKVENMIPYPIAMVDWSLIPLRTYRTDVETLKYYYSKQVAAQEELASRVPSDLVLQELALNRLIQETVTAQLLKQFNIEVASSAVDDYFQKNIVDPADDPEQVSFYIKELYNWDTETYKQKSIRPILAEQALAKALAENEQQKTDARNRLLDIQRQLESGASFEDLATQYSEDPSKTNGGDLGFFGRNEMVKPFEEAAFSLKPGEVSDIVETIYGFHLILMVDRATDDSDGDGVEEEKVHAKHILIKTKTTETMVEERLRSASVRILLPQFAWDEEQLTANHVDRDAEGESPAIETSIEDENP